MKMTPEHYAELKEKVMGVIDKFPSAEEYRKRFESSPKKIDAQEMRRWDLFVAAKTGNLINRLYKYLNDVNIDTAMKSIVAEHEANKS